VGEGRIDPSCSTANSPPTLKVFASDELSPFFFWLHELAFRAGVTFFPRAPQTGVFSSSRRTRVHDSFFPFLAVQPLLPRQSVSYFFPSMTRGAFATSAFSRSQTSPSPFPAYFLTSSYPYRFLQVPPPPCGLPQKTVVPLLPALRKLFSLCPAREPFVECLAPAASLPLCEQRTPVTRSGGLCARSGLSFSPFA